MIPIRATKRNRTDCWEHYLLSEVIAVDLFGVMAPNDETAATSHYADEILVAYTDMYNRMLLMLTEEIEL